MSSRRLLSLLGVLLLLLLHPELVLGGWKKKFKIKKAAKPFNSAVKKTVSYAESVGKTAANAVEDVKDFTEDAVDTVVSVTEKVVDDVIEKIEDVIETIEDVANVVVTEARGALTEVLDSTYFSHFESFGNDFVGGFDQGLGELKKGFHMAEGFAQQGMQCVKEAGDDIEKGMDLARKGMQDAKEGLNKAWDAVEEGVEDIYKEAAAAIDKVGDDALAFADEAMDEVYEAYEFIEDKVNHAIDFLENCFGKGDLAGCIPIIADFLNAIKELKRKVQEKAETVRSALEEMGKVLEDGFTNFGAAMEDYFIGMFKDLFTDPSCNKLEVPIPNNKVEKGLEILKPFGINFNVPDPPSICEPKKSMFLNEDLEDMQEILVDMLIGLKDPALDLLRKDRRLRGMLEDTGGEDMVELVCLTLTFSHKLGATPPSPLEPLKHMFGSLEVKWCPTPNAVTGEMQFKNIGFAIKFGYDFGSPCADWELMLGFGALDVGLVLGGKYEGDFFSAALELGAAGQYGVCKAMGTTKLCFNMGPTFKVASSFSDQGVAGTMQFKFQAGIDLVGWNQLGGGLLFPVIDKGTTDSACDDQEQAGTWEILAVGATLDFDNLPKRRKLLTKEVVKDLKSRSLLALPVEGNTYPIPTEVGTQLIRASGDCWYQAPNDRFICPVYSHERVDDGLGDGTKLRLVGSTGCEVVATKVDHWAWGDQRYFHFKTEPSVSAEMLNQCFAEDSTIDLKYGPATFEYPNGDADLVRTSGGCNWEGLPNGRSEAWAQRWRCPIVSTTTVKSGTGAQYVRLAGSGCSVVVQVIHWAWNGNGLYFKSAQGDSVPVNTCLPASSQIKAYYLPELPPGASYDLVRASGGCTWKGLDSQQYWRCPIVSTTDVKSGTGGEYVRLAGSGCSVVVKVKYWAYDGWALDFESDQGASAPVNTCLPAGSPIIAGDLHDCDKCHESAHCSIDGSCECNHGYNGDGFTCADVDECADETHECLDMAKCVNIIGGYLCECLNGLVGDGHASCDPPTAPSIAAGFASANALPDKPLLHFFLKTSNGLCLTAGAEGIDRVDFVACDSVQSSDRLSQLWSSVEGMLMSAKFPGTFLLVGDYYRLFLSPLEENEKIPKKFLWHISSAGHLTNEFWDNSDSQKITWLSEDFLIQKKNMNICLTRDSGNFAKFETCTGDHNQLHILSASGTIQNMALAETNNTPLVLVILNVLGEYVFKYMHVVDTQEFKDAPKKFYLNMEGKLVNTETGKCITTSGLVNCDDADDVASRFDMVSAPSMIIGFIDGSVLECLDGGEMKVTDADSQRAAYQKFRLTPEGHIVRFKDDLCLVLKASGSNYYPMFAGCHLAEFTFDYDDDTMQIFTFVQAGMKACKAGESGCEKWCLDFDGQVLDAGSKIQKLVLCDETKKSQQFLF